MLGDDEMISDLTDLIPEFNLINDDDLRKRVLAVWSEAMEIGGLSIDDLGQMPYTLLVEGFTGVGLCFKHDIPEAVMHIVATHSWEGDKFKRRPESIIFHHADFVDFDLTKSGH